MVRKFIKNHRRKKPSGGFTDVKGHYRDIKKVTTRAIPTRVDNRLLNNVENSLVDIYELRKRENILRYREVDIQRELEGIASGMDKRWAPLDKQLKEVRSARRGIEEQIEVQIDKISPTVDRLTPKQVTDITYKAHKRVYD